jgi:hypothetical protein
MKGDVILVGVGGQGVLSVAAIIAQATVSEGFAVRQSEVHGMAQRGGAANALKTGFETVKGEAAVIVMADLSDNLADVDKMYHLIKSGADIVCASRYMNGGRHNGGSLLKKIMSCLAGITLHYLIKMPTHDITNNFRMYSRNVLKKIKIESNAGFSIAMELTVKAYKAGMKIVEIPTIWNNRIKGKSKFKMVQWLPEYLRWYWHGMVKTKY